MKCFLLACHYMWIALFLSMLVVSSNADPDTENNEIFNRMVCENDKLVLNCKPGQVIKIERAYYGRYSITPCNKNHLKFTKGCVANDSMQIIQRLCENRPSCTHRIRTSLFRVDPCPNIDKVLEVNYKCVYLSKGKSLFQVLLTTTSTPKPTTSTSSTASSTKSIKMKTSTTTTNPSTRSTQTQTRAQAQTRRQMPKCWSKFEHENNLYEIKVDLGKLISFPCSFQSDFFSDKDPKLVQGSHLYKCEMDGNLYKVNSTCQLRLFKSEWLNSLNQELITNKRPVEVMKKLSKGLSDHEDLASEPIMSFVDFMKNISEYYSIRDADKLSTAIVEAVDNLLVKSDDWQNLTQTDKSKSITKLVDLVDKVLFEEDAIGVSSESIVAQVMTNKHLSSELEFPTNSYLQTKTHDRVYLRVDEPSEHQKFLFAIYKNIDHLFPLEVLNSKANKKRFINANIISFKVNDDNILQQLKYRPVRLLFKHLNSKQTWQQTGFLHRPLCSYWKYDANEFEGEWATDGCELESSNETHSICRCNHLTHFTILMDIYDTQKDQATHHKLILSILTIVLSIISCVCIIFTLVAFRYIKIIRRNRDNSSTKDLTVITTHLCICLLSSLLLFLTGILAQQLALGKLCSSIALLSHYMFLCSFFWMLLEGVQLYLMLVRIFLLEKSPIRKFCLIAYGTPFLIVSFSKAIDVYWLDMNGYGTQEHCWISNYKNFNLTFIVPISLILLANFCIIAIVFYSMKNSMGLKQSRLNSNKKQDKFYKSLLSFWCLISTLLGLPWILGYFIIDNQATLIFSYLFTIINTSQGTIIFIFNCLISKSVREEIFKLVRKQKSRLLIGLFSHDRPFSSHASNSSNCGPSNKQSTTRAKMPKKRFLDYCLYSLCSCSYPCSSSSSLSSPFSSTTFRSDQSSKKQATTNYLLSPQYSSSAKNRLLPNLDENQPLNRMSQQQQQQQHQQHQQHHRHQHQHQHQHIIALNNTLVALPKHNIRMLSSLPYMKRTSSLMSSSTLNSNNPTQSSYISPVILINTSSIPKSPPPPPPNAQELSTFKTSATRTANYDENQYLTPEFHNYSALDTDFNTDTQYYMDNGLLAHEDDYINNYDELDNDLVYLRSHETKLEADKFCYLKALNKLPNSSICSTSSQCSSCTSTSLNNQHSHSKLVSHRQNLKAKKLLQQTVNN